MAQLVETLDLLARAESGVTLADVRTETLVRLLARASVAQLDALGASDVARSLVLREVFRRMSVHLRADRAAGVRAVVRWRIACGATEHELFQTVIDGGSCVTDTTLDLPPRVTLTTSFADFLRLVTGSVRPVRLVLLRRLRIAGDPAFALRLARLFDIPARAAVKRTIVVVAW